MTRQCWFKPGPYWIQIGGIKGGYWEDRLWQSGVFHAWSQDFKEFDNGPGNYAAAIIEDSAGLIHVVHAESVNFGEEKPT
jgi:hypothetical protein